MSSIREGETKSMLPEGFTEDQLLPLTRTAPVTARSSVTASAQDVARGYVAFTSSRRAGVLTPSLTPRFDHVFPSKARTVKLSADAKRMGVLVESTLHRFDIETSAQHAPVDIQRGEYQLEDVLLENDLGLWLLLTADNGVSVRLEHLSPSGEVTLTRDFDGRAYCGYLLSLQPNGSPLVWGADGGDGCVMWSSALEGNALRLWRWQREELYLCSFSPNGAEALLVDNGALERVAFPDQALIAKGEFPEQDWNRLEQAAYLSSDYAVVSTSEGRLFGCDLGTMTFDAELLVDGYTPTTRRRETHLCTLLSLVPGRSPGDLLLCGDGEILRVDTARWLRD
ncbi:MAG: hypothetical protein H6726_23030 [Sandaracinaceae bacterium]|nr:hypothetical protein [Sandaracinaceae bacterium]